MDFHLVPRTSANYPTNSLRKEEMMSHALDIENLKKQGFIAIVWDKNNEVEDYCYTWETAQQFANDGYRIKAIANDGTMEMNEIQRICDYELSAAIDCFGEDHRK
jgi:hypothetical protein